MKIAIPIWQDRLSPVMDSARQLEVFELNENHVTGSNLVRLSHTGPVQKADLIKELGVDTLICGAISHHLFRILTSSGIKVIPFIKGALDKVVEAYLNGNLFCQEFYLPGYRGQGRCFRQGRCRGKNRYRNIND